MIRIPLAAAVVLLACTNANAVPLLGDFECLSDFGGPDTYHGTLRIEEPNSFGFLSESASVDEWYELDISNPDAVLFDDAFAERISAGATMVSARELEGEFSYAATVRTKKGDTVEVVCVYVY